MKRMIVTSVSALVLLAGNAYAEGCNYGSHAAMETEKVPALAAIDESEAQWLARLQKAREDAAALEALLSTPATYN